MLFNGSQGKKKSLNASGIHCAWSTLDRAQVLLKLNCDHNKDVYLTFIHQSFHNKHIVEVLNLFGKLPESP